MSLLRILGSGISKISYIKNGPVISCCNILISKRSFRKNYGVFLKVMKLRRKIIGPEKVRRRNERDNWNYKAELFAFSNRLNEKITEETLRQVFIMDSFVEREIQKRKDLDMPSEETLEYLKSNTDLANIGEEIISNFLRKYISFAYPRLPEEGIQAIHKYLMSEELLSHISFNLGTPELICCIEYPPEKSTLAKVLKAFIGSISSDDSLSRAQNFVLDFICPELVGKDVFEIWDLENPLEVLNSILLRHGHNECEPRLVFESGRHTIESIYCVGLYCNKMFLGKGPGETLDAAKEMAAYNVLRKLFRVRENESPLNFGERAQTLNLTFEKSHHHLLKDWHCEDLKTDLNTYLCSLNK